MQKTIIGLAGAGALGLAALSLTAGVAPAGEAVLYKNPQCSCCESYADYLRDNGFEVRVEPTHDLLAISTGAGVPEELMGCHTVILDGYVISGHVPIQTVNRLLDERPAITGITLPGMPTGSPGMSGPKSEPFTIYGFGEGGTQVYAVE